MIDVTRLRLLVALHELGTLHAAAARLHVSPSAASQQLATLAREAGAPLTEPDGRRIRLTDAGKVLVDHAYTLLAQLERAHGDVQATTRGELGDIVVGSFPSTIASLLVPALLTTQRRNPGLRISVREVKAPDSLAELAGGDLDLVVDVDPAGAPTDDPRYTCVPLGVEDVVVALPAGHGYADRSPVDLALLRDDTWISTIEGDACDVILHRACTSAGFRPHVGHRAGDWTAVLAMVAAGMGVAFVPEGARLAVPEGVVTAPTTGHDVERHVYAAVRRGGEARPAVAAYLEALWEAARDVSARAGARSDRTTAPPPTIR